MRKHIEEIYKMLNNYDFLLNELPSLYTKLRDMEDSTISWTENKPQLENIIKALEDLKSNINDIKTPVARK
tara:strand:- start:369 stop:581 length:213 start_codon:yes stop_codon:yes gene_type:complete